MPEPRPDLNHDLTGRRDAPASGRNEALWAAWLAGYGTGYTDGHQHGWNAAETAIAAAWRPVAARVRALANRPTRAELHEWQAAREAAHPALTPDQIRDRAYRSWDLPLPADQPGPERAGAPGSGEREAA